MKTTLTKTIHSLAFLGLMSASQANAAAKIKCIDDQSGNGFSILIPENRTTGKALVILHNGQKLVGTFNSKVINEMTRLAGATAIGVTAVYQQADYEKPHSISVSVVGYNGHLSGHAELNSLTGQPMGQIFVSCETQSSFKQPED